MGKLGDVWQCRDCLGTTKYKTRLREHVEAKHVQSSGYCCLLTALFCRSSNKYILIFQKMIFVKTKFRQKSHRCVIWPKIWFQDWKLAFWVVSKCPLDQFCRGLFFFLKINSANWFCQNNRDSQGDRMFFCHRLWLSQGSRGQNSERGGASTLTNTNTSVNRRIWEGNSTLFVCLSG